MPLPRNRALTALPTALVLLLACSPVFAARATLDRPATPFSRLDATSTHMLAITGVPAAQKTDGGATLLSVDEDAVRAFRAAGGGVLAIPAADGGTVELELE